MKTVKTHELKMQFTISRRGQEEPDVRLRSIAPQGQFTNDGGVLRDKADPCFGCSGGRQVLGRLCDACAVAEAVAEFGAGDFILNACGIAPDRAGVLTVVGRMVWETFDTLEGADSDCKFVVREQRWAWP